MTIHHIYVGCDISKDTIDFVDAHTGRYERIANSRPTISAFLTACQSRHDQPLRFAFEATGFYGRQLQACLSEAGLAAVQINPLHARRFAQSRGRLAKTDRIDATQLAEMAGRFQLSPTTDFCHNTEELKALITRRDQLVEQRAGEKKRSNQTVVQSVLASLQKSICQLSDEIAHFEQLIDAAIQGNPEFARKNALLQSVPGISKAIAPVLIAQLPEAGNTARGSIAALAGLAPFNHDSGSMQAKRSIAGGRRRVRRALYMAALGSLGSKKYPKMAQQYHRMKKAGKPSKVALIAIARKIVTIINAMLKTGTKYMQTN